MQNMKKLRIAIAASTLATLAPFAVLAAQPNNQACLGEDFSGYAKAFQPFGQTLIAFGGIIEGGIGDEVQAHLAGFVPDGVLPNSCNDGV